MSQTRAQAQGGAEGEAERALHDELFAARPAEGDAVAAPAAGRGGLDTARSSAQPAATPAKPEGMQYDVGFDADVGKAWRKPIGRKKAAPEWSQEIYEKPGLASVFEPVTAKFADGAEYDLPVTVEAWRAMIHGRPEQRVRKRPAAAALPKSPTLGPLPNGTEPDPADLVCFAGSHCSTNDKIRVVHRPQKGRAGLVQILLRPFSGEEKEKMICMITVGPNLPLFTCVSKMNALAMKFAQNEVQKGSLYQERDKLLQEAAPKEARKRAKAAAAKVERKGEEEAEDEECEQEEEDEEEESQGSGSE